MKVISVIEDEEIIRKILKHLGLWPVESLSFDLEALDRKVERDRKARPPPKATGPPKIPEYSIDIRAKGFEYSLVNDKLINLQCYRQ